MSRDKQGLALGQLVQSQCSNFLSGQIPSPHHACLHTPPTSWLAAPLLLLPPLPPEATAARAALSSVNCSVGLLRSCSTRSRGGLSRSDWLRPDGRGDQARGEVTGGRERGGLSKLDG